jgi:MFS family permease
VWALFAGTFINRFGSFVIPFLVLYLTRTGYSIADAGFAASAYGVGSAIASGVGGVLADHLGRRLSIAASMFGSAATMLLLSQARGLALIIPLTLLAGATSEMYRPAASALIADLIPAGERVTGFALYRLMINLGVAFGVALAGFLADHSFLALFVGDALTSVAYGFVALALLPRTEPAETRPPADQPPLAALRVIIADRPFVLFMLASSLAALVYFQSLSTLGLQVRADGLSNSAYGLLLSINGVFVLVCELPLTTWTQRQPVRVIIAGGYFCVGLGFALTGVATVFPLLALTVCVWTLGEMLSSPVASAYVADLAPAGMRGQYQGVWGVTASLALILAPALGARVFAWNSHALWLICGALGLLAAAIMYGTGKHRVGN